jgi:hypothetical protein
MYMKSGEEILAEMETGVPYSPDSIVMFKRFWNERNK